MAPVKKLSLNAKRGLLLPYNKQKNRVAIFKFVDDIPLTPKDESYNFVLEIDENLEKLSNIPMLICWGEKDFVFNLEYFKEWKKRFPQAEAHLFKNGGHYLFEDKKDETLKIIEKFLDS